MYVCMHVCMYAVFWAYRPPEPGVWGFFQGDSRLLSKGFGVIEGRFRVVESQGSPRWNTEASVYPYTLGSSLKGDLYFLHGVQIPFGFL